MNAAKPPSALESSDPFRIAVVFRPVQKPVRVPVSFAGCPPKRRLLAGHNLMLLRLQHDRRFAAVRRFVTQS